MKRLSVLLLVAIGLMTSPALAEGVSANFDGAPDGPMRLFIEPETVGNSVDKAGAGAVDDVAAAETDLVAIADYDGGWVEAEPAGPGLLATMASVVSSVMDRIPESRTGGKLLLTGGVSTIEGSGGGGLATWALTTGYGAEDGIGGNVHATYVNLPDYELRTYGAAVGLWDRVEISVARQEFDTGATGAALGLGDGFTFTQDVIGLKVKVLGDAIYAQDSWVPQVAVGVQHKSNDQGAVIRAVGGKDDQGTEFYVAASKLFLAQSVIVGGAVRWTDANQTGLLGFGGDKNDDIEPHLEVSAGWLVTERLVVGAEYRSKPDNLGFAKEEDAFDVFAAFAVNKHVSVTAAYVDLGSIATFEEQRGLYLSLQVGF